ncbi:MAG: Hpt domain-containing protein [Deferribacterales bacterium]
MTEIDMEKFRRSFLEEASELLEQVNEDVLKIEADADPELVNSVFRSIHTIKGSAAGFGFDHISAFTHHLETLLDKLRNRELEVSGELVDSILRAADGIYEMVTAAKESREYSVDEEGIIRELEAYMKKPADGEKPSAPEEPQPKKASAPAAYVSCGAIREKLRAAGGKGGHIYRADFHFTSEMLENGYDPLPVMSNLKMSSAEYFCKTDTDNVPQIDKLNPFSIYLQPEVYIISELEASDLADFGFEPGVVTVAEALAEEPLEAPEEHEEKAPAPAGETEYITMEGIDAELLGELAASIEDYFESIESVTLKLEKEGAGRGPGIDDLFRVFHTIKGDCGYVGFRFLEGFAHLVEGVLDDIRSGRIMFDKKAADIILSVVSDIREMLRGLTKDGMTPVPQSYRTLKKLTSSLESMKNSMTVVNEEVKIFIKQLEQFIEIINIASENGEIDVRQVLRGAGGLKNAAKFIGFDDLYIIAEDLEKCIKDSKPFDSHMERILRYLDELKSPPRMLGELLVREGKITEDDIQDALSKQKKLGDILVEEGKLAKDELDKALRKQEVMKAVADTAREGTASSAKQQTAGLPQQDAGSQTMKVEQEKIDKFTNTIGELVVAKNANEYLIQKIAREYDLPSSLIKELKDNANLIARISQDLQRDILSLRMIPIKQVFNKFPRVVRDISRKQNKQIDMRIIGEDTEIDKKVADLLSDPLVHLLRNSCDHGIETPEERQKSGKTPVGTVILKAYQEGSFVYIEVIDDGKGINTVRVREKAVSNRLISADSELSEKEIMQLILEPGFSTAEKVTDISGRGVGMDVVKTSVVNLGGFVDIQSTMGEGSRFVLKIPVTIGVSTALLVKLSSVIYAIPIENVAETIKLPKDKIKDLHYGLAVHYRGMVLPLYSMKGLLEEDPGELPEEVSIVITNTDMGKVGLMVDELINRIDIAIKPVPEYFSHLSYVGGITILGDGQAVLVLNTNKLI